MKRFFVFLTTGFVVTMTGAGCGRQSPAATHPVRGQVLFEGKPAPNALVVFHPVNSLPKEVPLPRAKVESDGSFAVGTFDSEDGAPAGDYVVTVEWWLTSATGKGGWQDEAPPKNRLPVRYSLTSASGLRARVEAKDNQLPTFELKK
jgi:hypothetical protein